MKFNLNKVIKCVSCLVTCCMLMVCAMATPALAATGGTIYTLPDYWESTSQSGNTLVDTYIVDDLSGSWYRQIGDSFDSVDDTYMSYQIAAGTSLPTVNFYYYYFGSGRSNGEMKYNFLDISQYNNDYLVSLTADFYFSATYFSTPSIDFVTTWMCRVKFYDANLNYIDIATLQEVKTITGGGTTGSVYDVTFDLDVPEDACYMVPYIWLHINPSETVISQDMSIRVERRDYFTLEFTRDIEKTDEEIAGDKLDDATGDLDDAGDSVGGAIDDYNGINSQLPTAPKDFSNVLDDESLNNAISDAQKVFDWDKSGLNYMYAPMTLSLGLAVLFYVVFGKGD